MSDGAKFVQADRLLDAAAAGPKWLANPGIAQAVMDVPLDGERRGYYELGAWVLMPNHVHLVLYPDIELARAVNAIKRNAAAEANRLLSRNGPCWAKDYFDRWIRNQDEERRITRYIENNPVKAGLCRTPEDWPWSSAGRGERRVSSP